MLEMLRVSAQGWVAKLLLSVLMLSFLGWGVNDYLSAQYTGNEVMSAGKQVAAKLPHERDESIDIVGKVPSEPMKQASRDLKRGLVDTDRGAEAGRTYKKLKQSQ